MAAPTKTTTERESSPESDSSTLSCINVADSSGSTASSTSPTSSTPPTSHDDSPSVKSDAQKSVQHLDQGSSQQPEPEASDEQHEDHVRRISSRARTSIATYNDKELAGTRIHTPTKYIDGTYVRKSGKGPVELVNKPVIIDRPVRKQVHERASALRSEWTAETKDTESDQETQSLTRRHSKRVVDAAAQLTQSVAEAPSRMTRRGREALEVAKDMVLGKRSKKVEGPAAKRQKLSDFSAPTPEPSQDTELKKLLYRDTKKPYINAGKFYNTGQDDVSGSKITVPKFKGKAADTVVRKTILPLPMFSMADKLDLYPKKKVSEAKRPFEGFHLPFDVFSPLPREAKVKWRELRRNEYKGEDAQELKNRAKDVAKKARTMEASTCSCTDTCDRETCFNATLFFECDDRSCRLGPNCGNRQFADLRKRHKDDSRGKYYKAYNVGVEIIATEDRGFGVRAMRTFDRDQIVVEYVGEIITQQESDRRMREEYKDHKCFYLMNFYDKLIIDGYRGNIARFVNHSCDPNCRMEKWMVDGEQRMALFANRPIMTGEELTWHYNFESYGQDQPCYCGSSNCAGVIGRQVKCKVKDSTGTKRKSPDDDDEKPPNKKQRLNNLAATASTKTKNIITKTKESLKDLIGSSSSKSAVVQENNRRDQRAARRSLVTKRSNSRPVRSSRLPSTDSPAFRSVSRRLQAVEPRRSKPRSSTVALSPRKGRASQRKVNPVSPAQKLLAATAEALESDSEDEEDEPAPTKKSKVQTPTKKGKTTPASNKSSSKRDVVLRATPSTVSKSASLRQSTLSFLPAGLGLNKKTVAVQKAIEGVRKSKLRRPSKA